MTYLSFGVIAAMGWLRECNMLAQGPKRECRNRLVSCLILLVAMGFR
jgi:hypothetical protein